MYTLCPIQFPQEGPPTFISFEIFTHLIDQFVTLKELHLQGPREPMLHPRFFDMVSYAVGKGIQVTTHSNLTLLNAKQAERCVTSGLARLYISIDGATAETYERIRIRARFERIAHHLELLLAAQQKLGSDRPHLHLVTVIMRQNLPELSDLVRLAYLWSMQEIFVQHLCHDFSETSLPTHYQPMGDFDQAETLLEEDPQRIERYFDEARQVAKTLGIKLRLPHLHLADTPRPEMIERYALDTQ